MALVKGTNSYAAVADADAYFSDRVNSSIWTAANNTVKAQALVTATKLLDNLEWIGEMTDPSQPMAFPRIATYFEPKNGCEIVLDSAATPDRILEALYELALHLITNTDTQDSTGGVGDLTVGEISLTKIQSAPVYPMSAKRLYKPLLVNAGAASWWRAN